MSEDQFIFAVVSTIIYIFVMCLILLCTYDPSHRQEDKKIIGKLLALATKDRISPITVHVIVAGVAVGWPFMIFLLPILSISSMLKWRRIRQRRQIEEWLATSPLNTRTPSNPEGYKEFSKAVTQLSEEELKSVFSQDRTK